MTLGELIRTGFNIVYCLPRQLDRKIIFQGPGIYSMDDNYTYHKGKFATWSRIHVDDHCEICNTHIPYPHKLDGLCEPCAIAEGDREEPDSCGETIEYGEQFDYE
tara:strand:+ start:461 stop:775 length:315 start_codon:yes stop_codon:yes gene_type:complete